VGGGGGSSLFLGLGVPAFAGILAGGLLLLLLLGLLLFCCCRRRGSSPTAAAYKKVDLSTDEPLQIMMVGKTGAPQRATPEVIAAARLALKQGKSSPTALFLMDLRGNMEAVKDSESIEKAAEAQAAQEATAAAAVLDVHVHTHETVEHVQVIEIACPSCGLKLSRYRAAVAEVEALREQVESMHRNVAELEEELRRLRVHRAAVGSSKAVQKAVSAFGALKGKAALKRDGAAGQTGSSRNLAGAGASSRNLAGAGASSRNLTRSGMSTRQLMSADGGSEGQGARRGDSSATADDNAEDEDYMDEDEAVLDNERGKSRKRRSSQAARSTRGKDEASGGFASPLSTPRSLTVGKGVVPKSVAVQQTVTLRRVDKVRGDSSITALRAESSGSYSFTATVGKELQHVPSVAGGDEAQRTERTPAGKATGSAVAADGASAAAGHSSGGSSRQLVTSGSSRQLSTAASSRRLSTAGSSRLLPVSLEGDSPVAEAAVWPPVWSAQHNAYYYTQQDSAQVAWTLPPGAAVGSPIVPSAEA